MTTSDCARYLWILVAVVLVATPALAERTDRDWHPAYAPTVSKAVAYLETQQAADGSFSAQHGPSVTALVATGLIRNGRSLDEPVVANAIHYVLQNVRDDGGIYMQNTRYRNYDTCLSIMCLAAANRDGRYDDVLQGAEKFAKDLQWDEAEGHDPSSNRYGGAGYGSHGRPDLSNTNMLIDALKAMGNGPDDPALERALLFVSRCQNLDTGHNTTPFAAKNPDGGFYYTPAAGGQSQAGQTEQGGLRSYGSMTYAGLKSMIYAGVGPEDPRVKAAYDWVRRHYSLQENPGMGDAGLYYYLNTFAKALAAIGVEQVTDEAGVKHDWRDELVDVLSSTQQPDGSWVNDNPRWLEGDPHLVTGYALLALSYCRPE